MSTETQRLYRSRKERMLGGVCGGLGQFLGIDPTVVRLLFVLGLVLWPGLASLAAYLLLMVIVPEEPADASQSVVDITPAES